MNSFLKSDFDLVYGKNKVSDSFIEFCERSIHREILRLSGIDMDKYESKICLTLRIRELRNLETQSLPIGIIAIIEQVPCEFKWKSEDGYKNIGFSTQEIDTSKVRGWIEGLDVNLLRHLFNPKPPKIMDSTKLSYALITEFFMNEPLFLIIEFDTSESYPFDLVEKKLDTLISKRNAKSEATDGKLGFIHDWSVKERNDDFMIYELDIGSADMPALREILNEIGTVKKVKKVTVTSFLH